MAPAVLAACSTGTLMPAAASSATRRSNSSSWRSVYARSSSCSPSATGRWVQTPSSSSRGSRTTADATATRSSGAAPTRCMPVSTFTCTATRRPAARAAAANAAMPFARIQRRGEPVFERAGGRLGAALAQQQDGRGDAVLAQLHALVDQRDRQATGAAGQRGLGHGRAAVPVPVGLDHRAELGRRGEPRQHPGVVGHRRQVDLRPGRARAPLGHGRRRRRPRRARERPAASARPQPRPPSSARSDPSSRALRTRATRAGRSPATRPSGGPS